jgi:hypothetical protein
MSSLINTIKNQIQNTKNILAVFQDERKTYQNKAQVGVQEIMDILKRKKRLVETFEEQHNIFRKINETDDTLSSEEKIERKTLIRDLSEMLEQLLVIDHENEKMLREIMSSNSNAEKTMKASTANFVERPALQRQLPFVPGQTPSMALLQKKSEQVRPKTENPHIQALPAPGRNNRNENIKTKKSVENILSVFQNKAAAAPKSRLKDYAQAAQLLQLSSKYA